MDNRIRIQPRLHRDWLMLLSFLITWGLAAGLAGWALNQGWVSWPFRRKETVLAAYRGVGGYLPVLLFAILSLNWLSGSDVPVSNDPQKKTVSLPFLFVCGGSVLYSVFLYATTRFPLKGAAYWPPVLILSLLNAVSEELLYRRVAMELFQRIARRPGQANLLQSLLYALAHVPIGGIYLGVYAFLYGLALGWVKEIHQSVLPGMVCHFCIDIGSIGLPLLLALP